MKYDKQRKSQNIITWWINDISITPQNISEFNNNFGISPLPQTRKNNKTVNGSKQLLWEMVNDRMVI